ncbi:hypothetical protein TrRE_jg7632 [Triparma retinervis]|uniref:Uncharacterized protein n=1 Tax=Triparma retinervis TaxID=2557542 RepID=A0A9W6ZBM5_9STRA|nr:hypothetical protein TrRE_jg7632 [Triparma retinervis]
MTRAAVSMTQQKTIKTRPPRRMKAHEAHPKPQVARTKKATLPKLQGRRNKKSEKRIDMHGRERKSTPSSDPLAYSSNTLPRPKSKSQNEGRLKAKGDDPKLRWVVDSREQLEYVASRRNELESRGTIAKRMYDRKMANNTTSINFDGFGENKIEYVSDMMRCYVDRTGMEGYERRDPFADSKKAKQLKQKLQKSNIDLGSGFGGNDAAWITDKQAGWAKVEHAKMQAGFAGRDPGQDWLNAQKLKKYLQRTTLDLDHAGAIATKDWRTDTQHRMEAASDPKYNHLRRDPFADMKKAKQLKQQLQKSTVDLGTGFGGHNTAWITDKQAGWKKFEDAKKSEGFAGRNPAQDWENAQKLKKYLQRTTLQLGFDKRYM